jgi:hypothetical protein
MELPMTATTDKAPTITVSNFGNEMDCFAEDEFAAATVTAASDAAAGFDRFDCKFAAEKFAAELPVAGIGPVDIVPAGEPAAKGSGQRAATTDGCVRVSGALAACSGLAASASMAGIRCAGEASAPGAMPVCGKSISARASAIDGGVAVFFSGETGLAGAGESWGAACETFPSSSRTYQQWRLVGQSIR